MTDIDHATHGIIVNMSERSPGEKFHGLIYGDSGSGKTYLLGEFPNPLVIDTDYGVETLAGKDVDIVEFYTRVSDDNARYAWPELLSMLDDFCESPTHETLAIDSLTTLIDVAVAHILAKAGRPSLQLQDYSPLYNELTKLIIRLRRVPTHVVLTAHEETARDDTTGKITIRPLVIGKKFPAKLPIYFNNIYAAIVNAPRKGQDATPDRRLLVQSDGKRIAKTQGSSEDLYIDKSYDAIIDHLERRDT